MTKGMRAKVAALGAAVAGALAMATSAGAVPKNADNAARCGCTCKAESATTTYQTFVDFYITSGVCHAHNGESCDFRLNGKPYSGKTEDCEHIDTRGRVVGERATTVAPGDPAPTDGAVAGRRPKTAAPH